ncbi:MAG: zinc-ribbon domain-containing protein [Ruminococcus sp.]|nr:zinc-ribbon domain-containing protein [Ruminococcus sp.]
MAVKIKTFDISGDYSPENVSSRIENYLRCDKAMETQLASYSDGYVLQAGKVSFFEAPNQRVAVTARFESEGGVLNVTVGDGLWSQKLGESKIGWFLADPSSMGPVYDEDASNLLMDEILSAVENVVAGKKPDGSPEGSDSYFDEAMVICSNCGTENKSNARFCKRCGCSMVKTCPTCGAKVGSDSMFCMDCGTRIV